MPINNDLSFYPVEVKARHIAEGSRGSISECPIALAFKEKREEVSVFSKSVLNELVETNTHFYPLPEEAIDFIRHFDDHRAVEPFSFVLGQGQPYPG